MTEEQEIRKKKKQGVGRSAAKDVAQIALTVSLIAVCAWTTIPIFLIPFTLQTFAVAFAGGLLGWKKGMIAVGAYILMGLIGIPVFSNFQAGTAVLFGPTGGYLFGFFFLTAITGLFKLVPVKNKWGRAGMLLSAMALGMSVCYLFGTVWFMLMYKCTVGYALTICVTPFLPADFVKFILAAVLCVRTEKYIK